MNITSAQYRSLGKRPSKDNLERIEKGLEPIESEEIAQMKIVKYMEMLKDETGRICKFTAIPNNTFTGAYIDGRKYKSQNQAKKQVAMGLRKGLCDLLIVYKPKEGGKPKLLFLEMKREKGGVVSQEQKEWIQTLKACESIQCEVAKGFEHAKEIIDSLIF